MKTLYYLCALLVFGALLSQGQDFRPINTSPVFLWGNDNYLFSGQNKQVLDVISSSDINNALLRNKINTLLSPHFIGGNSAQPELFFVFVENQLRTDQVSSLGESLHNIKNLIQTSTASMAIPYVHSEEKIGNEIVTGLAQIANKVVVATNGDTSSLPAAMRRNVIKLDKLLSLSSDNSWELLNNNQMDVVVVLFDSHSENMADGIATDDAFVGKVLANIESMGTKYTALFTAQEPAAPVQYYMPSSDPKMARFELAAEQVQADPNSCDGCLWPNDVQEGLIVIAPFIIILIIGVTCNFQIQSELKYDAERPRKF